MMGFKVLGVLYIVAVGAVVCVNVLNYGDSTNSTQDEEGQWGGVEPRHLQKSNLLDECISKSQILEEDIPTEFDARKKWIQCPSLYEIRDQGDCLSSYAVSIASVLTDRYCIATNGADMFRFSDQDLLGCSYNEVGWNSTRCSGKRCKIVELKGCDGGSVERAWAYLWNNASGLVSGALNNAADGCVAYDYKPCNHNGVTCPPARLNNITPSPPMCPKNCQKRYGIAYIKDKKVALKTPACQFTLRDENETEFQNFIQTVQLEIMQHGPVVAVMDLNEDWSSFNPTEENVIYEANDKSINGYHAVKIVGWGTNQWGKDYWLVANSFNYYWGQRGFFKIFRGMDRRHSAGINKQISTGLPMTPKLSV